MGKPREDGRTAVISEKAENAALATSLRAMMRSLLPEGCTRADQIARRAGLSRRCLQRYLAEEGHSFSALLQQTRLEMAVEMIGSGRRTTDIGLELGYADTANFIRAFRSWTGVSPRGFRRRVDAGQGHPAPPS
jgi:AraC-like DNA-binding protein